MSWLVFTMTVVFPFLITVLLMLDLVEGETRPVESSSRRRGTDRSEGDPSSQRE
jgi:hypothetical protein